MHILALSARDAANWLAARRLSCTCACRVSAARAVRAARLQNGTAALWWDVNHHSKSSLFCPLRVSVATVSYHLEVPHPPDPSNGFSPPSYSFDFGLPCFFFLFTSPRSFFTWSTYLITILFHLLSIILFFLSFFVLFPAAFCSLFFPVLFSQSFLLFNMWFLCFMQPHIWSHSHSWPAWQTLYILLCMQTHRRTQGSVIRLVSWTGQFAIHDVRAD